MLDKVEELKDSDLNFNFDSLLKEERQTKNVYKVEFETSEKIHNNDMLTLGKKAEENKIAYRKNVLIFLCVIIVFELIFINWVVWYITMHETFISDKIFSYFISGIFINLFALFKGITKYLYNDEKSTLLNALKEKLK